MRKTHLFILFFLLLLISSCSITGEKNNSGTTLPNATLLIVNASPDSSGIGMFVNGATLFSNLGYTDSVGYFQIGQSNYSMNFFKIFTTNFYVQDTIITQTDTILYQVDTVTVYKMDTSYIPTDSIEYQVDSTANVATANITVKAGNVYSLFLIDSTNSLKTVYVTDNLAAPSADSVKLRFFHFADSVPAVDLAASGGGQILFGNRSFNDVSADASYENFFYFKPGTYNLEVRLAGTSTVIATLPATMFTGGKIYTIYLSGFNTGTGTQAPALNIITNK